MQSSCAPQAETGRAGAFRTLGSAAAQLQLGGGGGEEGAQAETRSLQTHQQLGRKEHRQRPEACRPISNLGASTQQTTETVTRHHGAAEHTGTVRWFMATTSRTTGAGGQHWMPGRTEKLLQLWSPSVMPAVSPKITAAFNLLSNISIPQVDASLSLKGRGFLSLNPAPNIWPSRATILSRRKDRKLSLLSTHGSRLHWWFRW